MINKTIALDHFLKDFSSLKDEKGVTEVMINKPHEVWIEKNGVMGCHDMPELSFNKIKDLSRIIAGQTSQTISDKKPLLSGTLPIKPDGSGGERVQIVLPPATERNHIAMCIRVPSPLNIPYEQYKTDGAFSIIGEKQDDGQLMSLYKEKNWYEFIKQCVIQKKNIINSGGTSTGKTTFTNALIQLIPHDERLLTIEDSREVVIPHKNKVHLLASKGSQGVTDVGVQELLEASLRLRPDRIIQSELRGAEAFTYLQSINTGHPGSISTVHADSAPTALTRLNMMVMQANLGWMMNEINEYVRSVVDVIIQWKRAGNKRFISEVLWLGA